MAGLPNVSVAIEGGNLGRVVTRPDGVAGMIVSGVAVSGKVVLNTAYAIYSLKDAERLGITQAYDATNTTRAWRHIRDFYEQAGSGTELWIIVAAKTETLTQNVAKIATLRQATAQRLRVVGVTRVPASGYTPTIANGWDNDCDAAISAAKTLAFDAAAEYCPLSILIEGREIGTAYASLANQRGTADGARYVSAVVGDYESGTGSYVGLVLGRLASIPVQRSIARVRDGNMNKANAFIGTVNVTTIAKAALDTLHDKGVIFSRSFPGLAGWYLNGDENCDAADSDFYVISRTRVVEKARLLAYQAMLQFLNQEIEVDSTTGKLAPAIVADMQAAGNTALSQMEADSNVSSAELTIDPAQNVLSTDKVTGVVTIVPMGLARSIEITVAFSNPFNA